MSIRQCSKDGKLIVVQRKKFIFNSGSIRFVASTINYQNLQNSYLRRKRTEYYGILLLRVQILLKLGTHVASYEVFCKNNVLKYALTDEKLNFLK